MKKKSIIVLLVGIVIVGGISFSVYLKYKNKQEIQRNIAIGAEMQNKSLQEIKGSYTENELTKANVEGKATLANLYNIANHFAPGSTLDFYTDKNDNIKRIAIILNIKNSDKSKAMFDFMMLQESIASLMAPNSIHNGINEYKFLMNYNDQKTGNEVTYSLINNEYYKMTMKFQDSFKEAVRGMNKYNIKTESIDIDNELKNSNITEDYMNIMRQNYIIQKVLKESKGQLIRN